MKYKIIPLICFFLTFPGCSSNVGSYIVPGASIDSSLVYKIVPDQFDQRGLGQIIQRQLQEQGFNILLDTLGAIDNYDIKIVYGGQWQQDITWYLLNVDIRFYEKESGLLLASAYSYRTSLVRKKPEEIINEAISKLLTSKQKDEK
ncbi:hypothetical protein [Microbulbifer sp. TYP-18]|uniref:hypothetical protein n=1 Tax=Microbulbifer sp. TYP-18 TaxID=3230024 RepID=UPI0034C6D93A